MKKECPSCAMETDEDAKVCPICGYEFVQPSSGMKWVAILLLLISILFLFMRIF